MSKVGIAIVDYGMGNLRSVQKAFERLGYAAQITQDPIAIERAERVALPGVGAFGAAMANLDRLGITEVVRAAALSGKPFLGICLGMQLLLSESEEQGRFRGLDVVPGRVVRFFQPEDMNEHTRTLKIPHMGWNTLNIRKRSPFLEDAPNGASVYFVHSYYAAPETDVAAATTDYGIGFCSALQQDKLFATQFHPEKSGAVGLRMLKNFAEVE